MSSVVSKEERLYQIILKPVISEKTTIAADKHGQIVFEVDRDASKSEISQAVEKLFEVDDVVQVGQTIAVIEIEGEGTVEVDTPKAEPASQTETAKVVEEVVQTVVAAKATVEPVISSGDRFYSPLVKNIAKQEGISQTELEESCRTNYFIPRSKKWF